MTEHLKRMFPSESLLEIEHFEGQGDENSKNMPFDLEINSPSKQRAKQNHYFDV